MSNRIITNRCKCKLLDRETEFRNDEFKIEFCKSCLEVVSYERPEKKKLKKEKSSKVQTKLDLENYKSIDHYKGYLECLKDLEERLTTHNNGNNFFEYFIIPKREIIEIEIQKLKTIPC